MTIIKSAAPQFRFPNNTQRTAIVGRTGSGKTQFGVWVLSEAPFHVQPYIILDYKHDDLIGACDRIKEIGLKDRLPTAPGLYVIRPHPSENDSVEEWLWKVWGHENIGLYIDEGYVCPTKGPAFQAILTQGRSKHIPVITLTQRPVWLSRFVFSEADFYAIFQLNDERDIATVQQMIPSAKTGGIDVGERLPKYHCKWYDVGEAQAFAMSPVPKAGQLLDRLNERLATKRKHI